MPDIKNAFGRAPDSFNAFVEDTLYRRMEEEQPMNKKPSMILVFAIVALLIVMACTAVAAVIYKRSAQYEATSAAKGLLEQAYGIQPGWMRAFDETITQDEQGYIIRYTPTKNMSQLGEYTVHIPTSGAPTITWSYDGTDLADIAAQGFASGVWGAKQLEEWLALWDEYVEKTYAIRREKEANDQPANLLTQEEWVELDSIFTEAGVSPGWILHVGETRENDFTPEQAVRLARLAIKRKYGVDDEALKGHDVDIQFGFFPYDEKARYVVRFHHRDNPELNETAGDYRVELLSPSGTVVRCWRGMATGSLTLPEGALTRYEGAIQEFVQQGAYDILPDEEKVEVATRIHEAGFGELIGDIPHYIPQENAGTGKNLVAEAARVALRENYGLTDEMLAYFEEKATYTMEDGQNAWVVTYAPDKELNSTIYQEANSKLGTYRVVVSDTGGGVLSVTWTHDGFSAAGASYTENTWGTAPAWDASILPWFILFEKTVVPMIDEWSEASGADASKELDSSQGSLLYMESWAAIHAKFREAGFDRTMYCMGLPGEGDISLDEAITIAQEVLVAEYGLTREEVDQYAFPPEFYVGDPEKPYWRFLVQSTEVGLYKTYEMTIDGKTGEILHVFVDDRISNG